MKQLRSNLHTNRGVTLAEVMIVIAIIGIIAAFAAPSYQEMIERNRLKQAVEALEADLQWMRTEAIKRSCASTSTDRNNWVSFDTTAWSYSIYRKAGTCGCPAGSDCLDRTGTSANHPGITMVSATFGSTSPPYTGFDFRRGMALLAGNIRLRSDHYTAKVVVSPAGRVQICNIATTKGLPGYPTC